MWRCHGFCGFAVWYNQCKRCFLLSSNNNWNLPRSVFVITVFPWDDPCTYYGHTYTYIYKGLAQSKEVLQSKEDLLWSERDHTRDPVTHTANTATHVLQCATASPAGDHISAVPADASTDARGISAVPTCTDTHASSRTDAIELMPSHWCRRTDVIASARCGAK